MLEFNHPLFQIIKSRINILSQIEDSTHYYLRIFVVTNKRKRKLCGNYLKEL